MVRAAAWLAASPLRWVGALLLLALVRGLVYAWAVPPWQHPDEPTHFEHVALVALRGALPGVQGYDVPLRRAIAESMERHGFWQDGSPPLDDASLDVPSSTIGYTTLAQPPLYYLAAAWWLRPWVGMPIETQLQALRVFSVLLNLILVALGFFTARALSPSQPAIQAAVTASLVFQPMLTDIMAAVNNDAMANVLAAGFFLVLAWIFRRGASLARLLLAAILLAGTLLAKTTGLALLASVPLAMLAYSLRLGGRARVIYLMVLLGGLALAGAAAGGALDRLLPELVPLMNRYLRADVVRSIAQLLDPERRNIYLVAAIVVFKSFWGSFGWRGVWLPNSAYWALAGVTAAVVLGGLRAALGARSRGEASGGRAGYLGFGFLAVLVAWGLAIVRAQAYQGALSYLSHGRYAFVAIVPFALCFTLGWRGLFPARRERVALMAYGLALVAFDAYAFWGVLIPHFHG